jgi:hypothetical protein
LRGFAGARRLPETLGIANAASQDFQPWGQSEKPLSQDKPLLGTSRRSASRVVALAEAPATGKNVHVIQPIPIAILFAAAMALVWRTSGKRAFLGLAILWLAYAVYEYLMYIRVLCSGECNIRVDLLLIYPALLGSTLWLSLAAAIRAIKRRRNGASDA